MIVSQAWSGTFAGACVGVLKLAGARNPEADPALDALLDDTATRLRARYARATRADLLAVPELAAYAAYYRRFDKTYHVLLQLESVALKGKSLRARGALVGAMFAAELESGLLTAGHDLSLMAGRLTLDVAGPGDRYVGMGGREIECAIGDMCIRDEAGVISSVVYGPDERTRIGESTTAAVFTTYAPAGVGRDAVARHLESIAAGVRTFSPRATVESLGVFPES